MSNSGLEIGVGDGSQMSVFQGTLPVSYIHEEIVLPDINSGSSRVAVYDFDIPPEIKTPMFYVVHIPTVYFQYDFQHLGGTRWRANFTGTYYIGATGIVYPWSDPLVKSGAKIIVGGNRG